MLKLEKTSRNDDLMLRMRDRESIFNHSLWQALAIALMLHIGAFVLFHIQFFNLGPLFIFPRVQVKVENQPSLETETTFFVQGKQEDFDLLPPPIFPLSFPEISLTPLNYIDLFSHFPELIVHSFDPLEHRSLALSHILPPFSLTYQPIQMFIYGSLAEIPLLEENPFVKNSLTKEGPLHYAQVKYQVQVDENSGLIFWYHKKQSSGSPALDQFTEKLLCDLKFALNAQVPFLTGEIEFILATNEGLIE